MKQRFDLERRLRQILAEVAAAFDLTSNQIVSSSRRADICLARQVTMYVMRQRLRDVSLVAIGRTLRRNHSTVCYGISVIESALADDPQLQRIVAGLLVEPAPVPEPPASRTIPVTRPPARRPAVLHLPLRRALAA